MKEKKTQLIIGEPVWLRFTGVGLFLFGVFFLGSILKGVGALVAAIGAGQIIAGYLYPNTSDEINKVVEDFEKK